MLHEMLLMGRQGAARVLVLLGLVVRLRVLLVRDRESLRRHLRLRRGVLRVLICPLLLLLWRWRDVSSLFEWWLLSVRVVLWTALSSLNQLVVSRLWAADVSASLHHGLVCLLQGGQRRSMLLWIELLLTW